MNKAKIATGAAAVLLTGAAVAGLTGWWTEHQRNVQLQHQIQELELQEKRSAVDRSISTQMEEIAYQQKNISDEQREEALQQTRIANEMRQQAEVERQNALEAEHNAIASEKRALDASAIADNERQLAELQRIQAEFSKRVADTLSYIALGRSLGSMSTAQHQVGNNEIASLLAYASYLFTDRYSGDIYNPTVFQALMQSSQSKKSWAKHNTTATKVIFDPKNRQRLYTVSIYGEVMQHDIEGESLRSTLLFNNRNYDFRDIYIDAASQLYAVSRSGHLVVKNAKGTVSLPLDGVVHPQAISLMTDSTLLVVGERSMAIYDPKRHAIVNTRQLDYRVTAVSRVDYMPLLFDDQGRMHAIKNINAYKSKRVPIDGQVSTYASSKNTHTEAYGMTDGTIYLVTSDGTVHKLIGHRSRISKMKINGHRLYSSSYDGTLCLWLTNSKKIEPMTLFNNDNWIMDFTFNNSKDYVWTANQNGTLTEALISVPKMVQKIKEGLKRDFTRKEWDYYIGENIPFESFTGKEVAP